MPRDTFSRRQLPLPGAGRLLDVVTAGPPDGKALVFHSGTPSGPALHEVLAEAAAGNGLRYVNLARPGYGRSTPLPGRSVASVVSDTLAVLEQLGHDEFVTAGWSGGGPHALACGALAPARCQAVAVLAGLAPRGAPDLDWSGGMGEENLEEFALAEKGGPEFEAWLEQAASLMTAVEATELGDALGDLVTGADKEALAGPLGAYLAEGVKSAFEEGVAGWRDDDYAFLSDWGFSPGDCRRPTYIVQGSQDRMVPLTHGAWLAEQVAGARYRQLEGEGHISIWRAVAADVVAWLGDPEG